MKLIGSIVKVAGIVLIGTSLVKLGKELEKFEEFKKSCLLYTSDAADE